MRSQFMVRAGQFFFRFRSLLFPIIFISIIFAFRPHPFVSENFYCASIWAGFIITLLGEGVRVLTIGLDYIERGGKNRSPFASKLVTRGIYTQVRNPMYVGNLLIALGVGLYSGAPWVLVTILPFFVFVYYAIISAEEFFLRNQFGAEYEEFCRRVNRLLPSFRGLGSAFAGFEFNWQRVRQKDNGTAYYVFLALALVPLWRMHFLGNREGFSSYLPYAIAIAVVLTITYITVRHRENSRR